MIVRFVLLHLALRNKVRVFVHVILPSDKRSVVESSLESALRFTTLHLHRSQHYTLNKAVFYIYFFIYFHYSTSIACP